MYILCMIAVALLRGKSLYMFSTDAATDAAIAGLTTQCMSATLLHVLQKVQTNVLA